MQTKRTPPPLATRFLRWYCHPELLDEVEGDLYELFQRRVEMKGLWKAKVLYWLNVLMFLHPDYIRRRKNQYQTNHTAMYKSYLKIGWRNLIKNKTYSLINIGGLSLGMMCCLLLWLYIQSESSFDRHHQHADHLYLVNSEAITSSSQEEYPMLSAPYAEAIKAEFPEVAQVTRIVANPIAESKTLLQVQQDHTMQAFYETNGYQVDPTFFDVFTYHFTEGNAQTALLDPHSIVLSDKLALKLFGHEPTLGKIIRINSATGNGEDFKVTGVYLDESQRSHIDARFFVPISTGWVGDFLRAQEHNFSSNNIFYTYVRLHPEAKAEVLQQKLPTFMKKYAGNDLKTAGFDKRIFLTSVPDLHLYEALSTIVTPTSSRNYLYLLASIAILILLIACINFMNLATARSMKRAVEVGIRKVMGAERGILMQQFLIESMLIAALALLPTLLLSETLLPVFNQISGKALMPSALFDSQIIIASILLLLVTGFIAGSYPAFYLSVFKPVSVLKGKFANTAAAVTLRKSLIVFQFVISVGLVSATVVIYEQMDFVRHKSLGFNSDQQLIIPLLSEEARQSYTVLRHEILQDSRVQDAAGAMYYPGIANLQSFSLYRPDQTVDESQAVKINEVSSNFLDMMEFKLLTGRLFSPNFPADTNHRMVVNEATLQALEISLEEAVGQKLYFDWQGATQAYEIVGVVKDFHDEGLRHQIQPYAFLLNNSANFNYLIAHIATDNTSEILAFAGQQWRKINPNDPFEYSFLKEDFWKNHVAEERLLRIIGYFTILSIFISCLGLFGLSAFATQQRAKEIGIRKVLGASVANVVSMLSKDFIKLVFMAIIIATPLAWYAMHRWLQVFAYKIDIAWWMFVLTATLAIVIALLTVSFQSIKAALANPVDSLRNE